MIWLLLTRLEKFIEIAGDHAAVELLSLSVRYAYKKGRADNESALRYARLFGFYGKSRNAIPLFAGRESGLALS